MRYPPSQIKLLWELPIEACNNGLSTSMESGRTFFNRNRKREGCDPRPPFLELLPHIHMFRLEFKATRNKEAQESGACIEHPVDCQLIRLTGRDPHGLEGVDGIHIKFLKGNGELETIQLNWKRVGICNLEYKG